MHITWVIKWSKLCNLRCSYCYELAHLNDRTQIPVVLLETLFTKISNLSARFKAIPKFCWHGGEPLLLSRDYCENIFAAQQSVFEDRPHNIIQTNLSVKISGKLELLSFFDYVSISLDVSGGMRRDKAGRDSQETALQNMAALSERNISFGAISVLSQSNISDLPIIFDFFNESRVNFRILPFYRSSSDSQLQKHGLSQEQIAFALRDLIDMWFQYSNGISISPLNNYTAAAVRYIARQANGVPGWRYNKREREFVYIVDTDGSVYSVADTYNRIYSHGNIFTNSEDEILNSTGRAHAIKDAEQRMADVCCNCPYFGACSGYAMAEATPLEREYKSGRLVCGTVRPCIERILEWLTSHPDMIDIVKTSPESAATLPIGEEQYG